jgi:hypothetical protein
MNSGTDWLKSQSLTGLLAHVDARLAQGEQVDVDILDQLRNTVEQRLDKHIQQEVKKQFARRTPDLITAKTTEAVRKALLAREHARQRAEAEANKVTPGDARWGRPYETGPLAVR